MTFQSLDNNGEGEPKPATYEIGYGKPPAAYRFKKGRSGNPFGRPRKAKAAKDRAGAGSELAKKYLLEEAYRPVLVREGEHATQVPAIQAVFRVMLLSAIKGNRSAQRNVAELVQAVEAENRHAELDHFKAAVEYKCNWEEAIEHGRLLGRPGPEPIPHPDDIYLDFVNGTATVCGPLTKDAKAEWDGLLFHLDELQTSISNSAEAYWAARTPKKKATALERWKTLQRLFDRLNDILPKRYRKGLNDRCWEQGATRPGQHARHLWPNDY